MKRTLVPERDTCSLYGFQFEKRARFGDSYSYSRTLQLCLPEQSERYLIYCILCMGLLTYTSRDFKIQCFCIWTLFLKSLLKYSSFLIFRVQMQASAFHHLYKLRYKRVNFKCLVTSYGQAHRPKCWIIRILH